MSPTELPTCMKAGFILAERLISFSNRAIRSFKISSSADLTVEAIELNCVWSQAQIALGNPSVTLRKSAETSTITIRDEPARARFGIQSWNFCLCRAGDVR